MEKPYQLVDLVVVLKGKGLEIAEESAKILVESVFEWAEESAKLSENKYDDIVPFAIIKAEVLKLAEKINPAD